MFGLLTASLRQAMRSTDYTVSFISQRSAVIGAFRSSYCSIVPMSSCSLSGPLLYRSPVVVFFDRSKTQQENGTTADQKTLFSCCVFWSIKKHNNRRTVQQWTTEGTATRWNNGTIGGSKCTNHSRPLWYKWYRAISRSYRLKKTSSKQSKRRNLHLKWLHRVTNDNTLYY